MILNGVKNVVVKRTNGKVEKLTEYGTIINIGSENWQCNLRWYKFKDIPHFHSSVFKDIFSFLQSSDIYATHTQCPGESSIS